MSARNTRETCRGDQCTPSASWQPIETFPGDHPWSHLGGGTDTRYYAEALVYGPTWNGAMFDSPWKPEPGSGFTGEASTFIASTYSGAPCWTCANPGPGDYDEYVKPTHWMPLPEPPAPAREHSSPPSSERPGPG